MGPRIRSGRPTLHRSAPLVLATLCLAAAAAGEPRAAPLEVEAQTIDAFDPRQPERTRFGALTFRGGLVLKSASKDFGGISSIIMDPGGARFIAATDKAQWLRGRIVYDGARPAGIAGAELSPMLGADGRPLGKTRWYDSEALAEDGGTIYAAFERIHGIQRFDFARHGVKARGRTVPVPPAMKKLPSNRSLECLAIPQRGQPLAGTLIAISERGLDAAGNIAGWLIGGPSPGAFSVARSDDFDVSDCTVTPRGDLLILERRFSWLRGVAMRIRRLPLSKLAPGVTADGPQLIFADMGYQVDNMEGIGVHAGPGGALILTLVSDDNFSPLQRNLLLQFSWSE